jgi:4-hydroxy-tetrahydrodipicolinate synthase
MTDDTLRGVCPIVDTPFTEDGAVDYESLERLVDTLASDGCHALALFGYASEFYKLDPDERTRMTDVVVEGCAAHGVPSIVSVTAQSTQVAVDRAEAIEAAGADALMLLPPHVRGPPVEGVADHVRRVAEAVSLPVMVQYAPGSTNMTLPVETLATLYNTVDNVDSFKIECDPPGAYIEALHERTDGEADVFVGRAGYEMIEGFDRGCVGVMPASAMYDVYLTIYDHIQAGRREEAMDVHSDLVAALNQLTRVGIQFEKRILARRGLAASDHCRSPETTPDEVSSALMDEHYERYLAPHFRVERPAED